MSWLSVSSFYVSYHRLYSFITEEVLCLGYKLSDLPSQNPIKCLNRDPHNTNSFTSLSPTGQLGIAKMMNDPPFLLRMRAVTIRLTTSIIFMAPEIIFNLSFSGSTLPSIHPSIHTRFGASAVRKDEPQSGDSRTAKKSRQLQPTCSLLLFQYVYVRFYSVLSPPLWRSVITTSIPWGYAICRISIYTSSKWYPCPWMKSIDAAFFRHSLPRFCPQVRLNSLPLFFG